VDYDGQRQIQQVGSTTAAYSLSFNPFLHFGLGTREKPVKLVVQWTNGEIVKKDISEFNRIIFIGMK